MEFSKDKAVAMKQVIEMLDAAMVEAGETYLGKNGWVVCFERDALPFRQVKGSKVISAFGGDIVVFAKVRDADTCCAELNTKTTSKNRVTVLPIGTWFERRVTEQLSLIAAWKQQAAEQGITL